jgi:capsular exopolysaccharide synthesis family protein
VPKERVRWEDMSSTLQKQMDELRFKRSELLTRYTAKNPAVLKIEDQIHALEKNLSPAEQNSSNGAQVVVRVDPFKVELINNFLLYEAQLAGITTQLESVRVLRQDLNRKLIELPVKTVQLERLKRQKEVLEKLVEDLSRQYQQEKLRTGSRVSNIEIIEAATAPVGPFSPNRPRIGVIGLFLGLVFGVGAAFVLNEWDNTLNGSQEVKRLLGLTPLGLLPRFWDGEKFINPLRTIDHQVEIFNLLRNNIRYGPVRDAQKCLLIASAVQREGKSFIAMNLAISFAMEGQRTLLVSADLRQPREFLPLRYSQPPMGRVDGLAEYLLGEVELENILLDTDIDNLSVIATGTVQRNPGKLLSGRRFAELLARLEKSYDAVIIDAPAILPVVDTTLISPLVRGVLLVVEAGKTPVGSARQAISRLEHVGSVLVGGVLNQATNIRLDYFYGHGYARYKEETSAAD